MHKVVASNLFPWADVSGKLELKCLLEFLNKVHGDFSYKLYFQCKKKKSRQKVVLFQ